MDRRELRRLAQSNLILRLLDEAAQSGGRLHVESFAEDAILLGYRDVRTLVRRGRNNLARRRRNSRSGAPALSKWLKEIRCQKMYCK